MASDLQTDGIPYEEPTSLIASGDSGVSGNLLAVPLPRTRAIGSNDIRDKWTQPLSVGDATEDDGGFKFITSTNHPSVFKSKHVMRSVRQKAMSSYLDSEKRRNPTPQDKTTSDYLEPNKKG